MSSVGRSVVVPVPLDISVMQSRRLGSGASGNPDGAAVGVSPSRPGGSNVTEECRGADGHDTSSVIEMSSSDRPSTRKRSGVRPSSWKP